MLLFLKKEVIASITKMGGKKVASLIESIKKELNALYKKNLAKYEMPREIRFIKELPKTKLAKVDFRALEQL